MVSLPAKYNYKVTEHARAIRLGCWPGRRSSKDNEERPGVQLKIQLAIRLEQEPDSKPHRSRRLVQVRLLVTHVASVWLRSYASQNRVQQRAAGVAVGIATWLRNREPQR